MVFKRLQSAGSAGAAKALFSCRMPKDRSSKFDDMDRHCRNLARRKTEAHLTKAMEAGFRDTVCHGFPFSRASSAPGTSAVAATWLLSPPWPLTQRRAPILKAPGFSIGVCLGQYGPSHKQSLFVFLEVLPPQAQSLRTGPFSDVKGFHVGTAMPHCVDSHTNHNNDNVAHHDDTNEKLVGPRTVPLDAQAAWSGPGCAPASHAQHLASPKQKKYLKPKR